MDVLIGLLVFALAMCPILIVVLLVQQSRTARRLQALEDELVRRQGSREAADTAGVRTRTDAPLTPPAPKAAAAERATPPAAARAPAEPAESVATKSRSNDALEAFVGGRVMLVVGVVAVLFAVGFFLKLAIDRGWFGGLEPAARVSIGVALGLGLLVWGQRFVRKQLTVFGHALMGAGLGTLYLSNFFAAVRYELIELPVAYVLVGSITALSIVLALRRGTRILAWLGFLGGYLAPALLGTNVDALGPLTAWLAVLHGGVLAVLVARRWAGLEVMATVASAVYFLHWYAHWFGPDRIVVGAWCLTALLTAVMLVCLAPALIARRAVAPPSLWSMLIAALLAFGAGHALLMPEHRIALGLGIVGVGLAQMAAGWVVTRRVGARTPDSAILFVFGLAAFAIAVPVFFDGRGMAPAWSGLGLAAVFAGARRDLPGLVVGGMVMLLLGALRGVVFHSTHAAADVTAFLNADFLMALLSCAALLAAGRILARSPVRGADEAPKLQLAGLWAFALPLGWECFATVARQAPRFAPNTTLFALSAAAAGLAVYACVLAGVSRGGASRAPDARNPWVDALPAAPWAAALVFALLVMGMDRRLGFVPGLNFMFGAELMVTGACFVCGFIIGGSTARGAPLLGLILLLLQITWEIHRWGRYGGGADVPRVDMAFRAQLAISVTWALYASALLVLGFRRHRPGLRWIGLILFAITVGKVFLVDMARLETGYRVGSFLALGLLLVAASYLYQRMRQGDAGTPPSLPPQEGESP